MKQILHRMSELLINSIGYTELYTIERVCVCACVPMTKYGNIVLEQGLREIFVLKTEGVVGGWTELYSEGLHGLYW